MDRQNRRCRNEVYAYVVIGLDLRGVRGASRCYIPIACSAGALGSS
jgi:hypothetical protein